jgi:hypothetical protein
MSNHHIMAAVSRKLRSLLWQGFKADEATRSFVNSEKAIKIGPPQPGAIDGRLYIWLYQIRPNLYQADLPMRHITDVAEPAPLPLDLWYMLTPMLPGEDQDGADQVILARTLQVMAANAHIAVEEPGFAENLRVILEDPPIQDQIMLWRALRMPMRLSAYYQLMTVRIDPLES